MQAMENILEADGFDPIHERIMKCAAAAPDRIAVVAGESELSYGQLLTNSRIIQSQLQSHGVAHGDVVAVLLRRSSEFFTTILAILATGACFLPIDPEYPPDRISFMLTDANPKYVVTSGLDAGGGLHLDPELEEILKKRPFFDRVIRLSTGGFIRGAFPLSSVSRERKTTVKPCDAAYIIYTSGSTGVPKGVIIEHRGIPLLSSFLISRYGISSSSRVMQFSALSFDAMIMEMIMALASGAALVLTPSKERLSPDLCTFISDAGVTHALLPPSLLPSLKEEEATTLEALIVGGEACPSHLIDRWSRRCNVFNAYGPTEATICATTSNSLSGTTVPPLGSPVEGTNVLILNERLETCLPNEVGEIYITGKGLARGYLYQASLTACSFVANPLGPAGSRMYRTGDLARRAQDGVIQFEGRIDEQVKIRGVRVELEEVSAAMRRLPGVHQAVAATLRRDAAEPSIHGYLVLNDSLLDTKPRPLDMVDEWSELYDTVYQSGRARSEGSDYTGWQSSYDGAPIDKYEMEEWRAQTVKRIRALKPRRLLEVGFGSGLILERLIQDVEEYVGTEISSAALENLRARHETFGSNWQKVSLLKADAEASTRLFSSQFDVIVLNSVTQYFPGEDYTARVINGLLNLLTVGGSLFVGDVRNADLQTCFAVELELSNIRPEVPVRTVLGKVANRLLTEKELLLPPQFFHALVKRNDFPVSLEIRIKDDLATNELTKYRYDVIFHKGKEAWSAAGFRTLIWGSDISDLPAVFDLFNADLTACPLRISGLPNPRVFAAQQIAEAIQRCLMPTIGEYICSEEVEDCFSYANRHPSRNAVDLAWTWAPHHGPEYLDLIITRRGDVDRRGPLVDLCREVNADIRTTDIARIYEINRRNASRLANMRMTLSMLLPSQMVPTSLTVVDRIPLTPNGKLDKEALPPPVLRRSVSQEPETDAEASIRRIFAEVLGLEDVGLDSNFFDLGGHSLLATRLVRRVRSELGLPVSVATLFQAQSVRSFARAVQATPPDPFAQLLPLKPFGRGVPLFCIHPVTGVSWGYANMLPAFNDSGRVFGIQAPGLNQREPTSPSLGQLINQYCRLVRSAQPLGPYHLLGYSSGGLLAHMIATELQAQGFIVDRLVIVDSYPSSEVRNGPLTEQDVIRVLLGEGSSEEDPSAAATSILEFYRRKGGLFEELAPHNVQRIWELTEATLAQSPSLAFKKFSGDILVFKSKLVAMKDVERWRNFASGHVEITSLDWTHAKLLDAEPAAHIGTKVEQWRDQRTPECY